MKLLQYLLWVLVIYFAIRVIRSFITIRKRSQRDRDQEAPFVNIEDADFEDITEKGEGEKKDADSKSS